MKKSGFIIVLLFFATTVYAQNTVEFTPPPSEKEAKKMAARAALPTSKLIKKEGKIEHKSFAINKDADYRMYVEFLSGTGRKYTIPAVFASWVVNENGTGLIEIFKDSITEGYPALTFTLSEKPYFWKQLK